MKSYLWGFFIAALFLGACSESKVEVSEEKLILKPTYAKGFALFQVNDSVYRIKIYNPADTQKILQQIDITKVTNPTFGLYSSTYLAMLNSLNAVNQIKGINYIGFIKNPKIQQLYAADAIKELQPIINDDIESILELKCNYLVVSPEQYSKSNKAVELGQTVLMNTDYLENTPLARLEWIKFFGFLTGKDQQADSIFKEVESNYLNLKTQVENEPKKTIFSGQPYQGTCFVPGGNSYKANFLKDAGVTYIFKDDKTGSQQLDFEVLLDKAVQTDYWEFVTSSEYISYSSIVNEDERFANFNAVKNKNVVVCNTSKVDFYETGVVEPHIILADLIHVFHPSILPNHKSKYYFKLK